MSVQRYTFSHKLKSFKTNTIQGYYNVVGDD